MNRWTAVSDYDYYAECEHHERQILVKCATCGEDVVVAQSEAPPLVVIQCQQCSEQQPLRIHKPGDAA